MGIIRRQETGAGGLENRLFKMRMRAGVWAGKLLIALTRILGRGGTTLPGRTALRIAPGIDTALAADLSAGSFVITGTNGKTTTAALITGILQENGYRCIHNQSGSNMSWGVTTALIEASSWQGKLCADCAVMEVDEGAFAGVTASLRPLGVVVTNVFRDQLDRYGEVDRIQGAIRRGLEAQAGGGFEVINADDPTLACLNSAPGVKRWMYGFDLDLPADTFENTGRDTKTCPLCSTRLAYSRIYYAHLGDFYCPACAYRRQEPAVKLTGCKLNANGSSCLQVALPGKTLEAAFPLPGLYNLYNMLAAVTCATAVSVSPDVIGRAIAGATPSFGRMETFNHDGREIVISLVKNPVGANEVLRTILARPGRINLLVAINDKVADGTDVSWLWDVDFEQLSTLGDRLSTVVASGLRAWDMAVRFKYSGIEASRIRVEEDAEKAIRTALDRTKTGESLFILPTYTAMLELRRRLNKLGLGRPYWED